MTITVYLQVERGSIYPVATAEIDESGTVQDVVAQCLRDVADDLTGAEARLD